MSVPTIWNVEGGIDEPMAGKNSAHIGGTLQNRGDWVCSEYLCYLKQQLRRAKCDQSKRVTRRKSKERERTLLRNSKCFAPESHA